MHYGITQLPNNIIVFNGDKFEEHMKGLLGAGSTSKYANIKQEKACPTCGKIIYGKSKYCSVACSNSSRHNIKWESIDLYDLIYVKRIPIVQVGKMLGCSGTAIRKRIERMINNMEI